MDRRPTKGGERKSHWQRVDFINSFWHTKSFIVFPSFLPQSGFHSTPLWTYPECCCGLFSQLITLACSVLKHNQGIIEELCNKCITQKHICLARLCYCSGLIISWPVGTRQATIISKVNFPYCHPAGSLKTLSREDSGVGLFDITSGDSFPWSGLLTWDPFTIGFCLFYFYVCMFCFGKVSLEYGQIQMIFLCVPCQDQTSMSDFGRRASVHNL